MITTTTLERPHGYARYKLDRCRCNPCGWAVSQYETHRLAAIAAGTWQPYVDAAPARAHLQALSAAGVGRRRVAELTGIADSAIGRIMYGGPGRRPPTRRIRPDNERLILAIPVEEAPVADGQNVDATGTIRRIQALHCLGWTFTAMADRIGWTVSNLNMLLTATAVRRTTADLVAGLYEQLSMTHAPGSGGATRARRHAQQQHWFPPLAWDDDAIGDPAAAPALLPPLDGAGPHEHEWAIQHRMAGHGVDMPRSAEVELIVRLSADGWTSERVGRVLGRSGNFVREMRKQVVR